MNRDWHTGLKKKKDPSIYPGYKKSTLHVITSLKITMTDERN